MITVLRNVFEDKISTARDKSTFFDKEDTTGANDYSESATLPADIRKI